MIWEAFRLSEAAIRRYLRRFIASDQDIDDICQEAVTRALEAAKTKSIEDPKGFLFGVARNVMRKELDKKSRSLVDFINDFSPDDEVSVSPSIEHHLDDQQRLLEFMEVVSTLPRQCQRVFVMKKVYGYSHREIASQLEISVSTVEKHVAAGMRRCLDALDANVATTSCEPGSRRLSPQAQHGKPGPAGSFKV